MDKVEEVKKILDKAYLKPWCKDSPTLGEPDKPFDCPEDCNLCVAEQICQLFDKRCKECEYDPEADKFGWAIDKGWLPKEEAEMLKAQEQQRVENFIENCELPCPHGVLLADTSKASKKDCDECWQVLKKEGI